MKHASRLETIIEKIPGEVTHLRGSIYVHVDYDPYTKRLIGVRFSHRQKDGSTLDATLTGLGDTITSIVRSLADSEVRG